MGEILGKEQSEALRSEFEGESLIERLLVSHEALRSSLDRRIGLINDLTNCLQNRNREISEYKAEIERLNKLLKSGN